jgi:class 3 adenylate cyclase
LCVAASTASNLTILHQQHIYPSSKFRDSYRTITPKIYAAVVAFTFVLVAVVFFIYDLLVQHRNEKIVVTAARSNALVSSMFPDAIRDRLLQQNDAQSKQGHLKSYLMHGDDGGSGSLSSKPLADLFLETTVLFADISGFTAWSSVRDPTQVFTLLEEVYKVFDAIASRRRVFKVETVGDCYVAVTGLPEPKKDHAVIMARFAKEIMQIMGKITRTLELTLGPGTADLKLRIGMHSGPVTGGVLRGERSRFQLFGDTMNTTARVESTGAPGCIHLSSETAGLLIQAGKQSWLKKRDECVVAKGKGAMQTYWLCNIRDDNTFSVESDRKSNSSGGQDNGLEIDELIVFNDRNGVLVTASHQTCRLINWNVELLLGILREIVARRSLSKLSPSRNDTVIPCRVTAPIDEVQEIITLPEFDNTVNYAAVDATTIVISQVVVDQLKLYITWVASMYRDNPFHNFNHASHVVMSVMKLLSRIVAPTDQHINDNAATLHDHTYGITSDPLTQFACVFSALIHDVDHTGVPNATLVAEHASIAAKYNNRSVAEQNSLDLAWDELMNEMKYKELHSTLFSDQAELIRFRKLVVNGVMATDIADKELKILRNNRWDKAFKDDPNGVTPSAQDQRDAVNRKATIVIEHLIQASDVSHTMQHWHVFRKWNQALFEEMYDAYSSGRAEQNPADFWYQGEIGFFDYYIIPLAKKLKDCGVFGVSSDEYLNYAMKNREEWEIRGHEVVMEMVEAVVNRPKRDSPVMQKAILPFDAEPESRYIEC